MGAPHRRTIYTASLEAHVDRLHSQLLSTGYFPIAFERLEPFRGLNSRTAKVVGHLSYCRVETSVLFYFQSLVAGLQHDASLSRLKLLELERSVCLPAFFKHPYHLLNFVRVRVYAISSLIHD